jgi:predicted dehydrogenase
MNRRSFVRAGAGAALAASRVLGANDRLRIGFIGCGGQGTSHMNAVRGIKDSENVEIAAVCDVFDHRAERAAALTGAKSYRDYRRVFDNKDIDAVLIATPDHWHAELSMQAATAGKHVYCEKPMTHTIEEALAVVEKVKATKIKMQVGVQAMSDDSYETAYRYVQNGTLGKVVVAQIDYSRNYRDDFWLKPTEPDARPQENLDWNMFLGPAQKRPWDPDRYFQWIRYWDYSNGIPSGLLVHRITRLIRSLGLTFPEFASGHGGKWQFPQSKAEIPDTFNMMLDYPGGPTVLLISSMANDTLVDHTLRGHKATLTFTRTGFTITPQPLYRNEVKEVTHKKTGGEDMALHHRNWYAAIRKGEPLKCDATLGMYGVVACEMGVISLRRHKYMRWDAQAKRAVEA